MVEPVHVALVITKKVTSVAVRKFVTALPKRNDEKFAVARQNMFEDWTIEIGQRTEEQYKYLSGRVANLEVAMAEREDDPALPRVYANYARAADAEAIDERRRMLAFAAAALVDARLTIAQHSRVERTLRELDPDDVLWLAVIDQTAGNWFRGKPAMNVNHLRALVWGECPSADILVSSGAVRVSHTGSGGAGVGGHDELIVTREGHMVLRALRLFIQNRTLPASVPGRERREDDRSEAEAWEMIGRLPGLRDATLRLAGTNGAMYQLFGFHTGPLPPKKAAVLRVFKVPAAEAAALEALAPYTPSASGTEEQTAETIAIEARDVGPAPDERAVNIRGPHDVLRWLADEVSAHWY